MTVIYWKDKLKLWKSGKDLPIINKNIYLECSPVDYEQEGWGFYYENQIKANVTNIPDYSNFKDYIDNKKCVSFKNLDKTCQLVIPPNKNKNFTNIYLFYKNSTETEKKDLWKKVAIEITKNIKLNKKIWISTHGHGVAWLHIRLCKTPTYYHKETIDNYNKIKIFKRS
jgi:hypothetical protein